MDTASFLKAVITTDEGYFQLLIGPPVGNAWHEEWFRWPEDLDAILRRADDQKDENNVYFTAHLFGTRDSRKEFVLPSRTIQADLDNAVAPISRVPSILVNTSPGRHQAYWILKHTVAPDVLEGMSRALTYSISEADRSGWSLGHKMRLPGTFNHKYIDQKYPVVIRSSPMVTYQFNFEAPPVAETLDDWMPGDPGVGPREIFARIKKDLPKKIRDEYDRRQNDRSAALFGLMTAAFRLGLSRDEVFVLAKGSANNKFVDHKYHADTDLAKDVLRAERNVRINDIDGMTHKERIAEIKRSPGPVDERRRYIAEHVRDTLLQMGSFTSANDGNVWYTTESDGRPVPLSRHNDYFNGILENIFGLNAVEQEQRYTVNFLISNTQNAHQGVLGILSHYDVESGKVLLHTGRREVLAIDRIGIQQVSNGDMGVIFPWRITEEPFEPDIGDPLSVETIFENCFDNIVEMDPKQAMALIRSWLVFLILRSGASARPILAFFGQPGSGKSTLARRIYRFLYGQQKSINLVTNAEDFDHAVSTEPFVVFDNLDTWERWLPDRLAASASSSVLAKRKLYSDNDSALVRRQALVGITAFDPKIRREDIIDRLLMFMFHRLESFKPEEEILRTIVQNRNRLWGGMIHDVQKVLQTPQPRNDEIPQFRIHDFARIGLWVSRALGFEDDFRAAITENRNEQEAFNLEDEEPLIEAIKRWLEKQPQKEWYSGTELWNRLSLTATDTATFTRRYRNAVTLNKKLWSLQAHLRRIFSVEYQFDDAEGKRLWRIQNKTSA